MNRNIFPSLKILDTTGKKPYYLDMFYQESTHQELPVITFISEDKEVVHSLEDIGLTGSELVKEAFQNLRNVNVDLDLYLRKDGPLFLEISNKSFAAEKILDKDFLKNVARRLDASVIKVAIPVEDAILVCPSDDPVAEAQLEYRLSELYNDFSRRQISKEIYLVEDGVIKSAETLVVNFSDISVKSYPASYNERIIKSKLFNDIYNVRLSVQAQQVDDLKNGLFLSILKILSDNVNKDFNGTIEIQGSKSLLNKDEGTVKEVKDFFAKLKLNPSVISLMHKHYKEVKITFLFLEDFQKGNVHNKIITILNKIR